MKLEYDELQFLKEILFSYTEDLFYNSENDISEDSHFTFCLNLLNKLSKKLNTKSESNINLILRRK